MELIVDAFTEIEDTVIFTLSPFVTSIHEINYSVLLEDVSYGSDITFIVEFLKNGNSFQNSEYYKETSWN